jgi:hypothetical protein
MGALGAALRALDRAMDPMSSGRCGDNPRARAVDNPSVAGRVGRENTKLKAIVFRVIAGLALHPWTGGPDTLRKAAIPGSTDTRCQKSSGRRSTVSLRQSQGTL